MSELAPQLIAAGAGVIGGFIGAGGALLVYSLQRRERQSAEQAAAWAAFAAALDVVISEIRRNSPQNPRLRRAIMNLNRRLAFVDWVLAPLIDLLAPRASRLGERCVEAVGRVLAVAAAADVVRVNLGLELIRTFEPTTAWEQRWAAYRNDLADLIRKLGGA